MLYIYSILGGVFHSFNKYSQSTYFYVADGISGSGEAVNKTQALL